MIRFAAIASVLAVAMSQPIFRRALKRKPTDYLPPQHASHDAELIAKAEAKRPRKAAKRVKQAKVKP